MENQSNLKWYQKPVAVILLIIFIWPIGLIIMWVHKIFNLTTRLIISSIPILFIFLNIVIGIATNNSSASECENDVRAYEFGREMSTYYYLSEGRLSLSEVIEEYSNGIGINRPYESSNPCVKAGFREANNNIDSPYNIDGKSWTSF
uniref:hypothetical protein n=1 Tax=Gelidibacter sp. TaxID=2018083 RepID=UPI00404A32F8